MTLRGMTRACWSPLNDMLESVLTRCNNRRLIHDVLRAYQTITNTCGVLELVQVRDTFISSLCRFALPNLKGYPLDAKNIQALESLFNIAHCLGGFLENSWMQILETFAHLDGIIKEFG